MSNLKKGKEVRDRERAKNKGRGTGGGKKFSIENEDELAIRNRIHGDDDDDDEEEEEKPKDNVFGFAKVGKAVAAAAEESDEDESGPVNPNRAGAVGPSRKEREAADAAKAKEDYMRRHLAGETEQAKKDMERLAIIRARREAQAKQREAEGRPPGWSAEGIDSDVDLDEVVRKPQKPAAAPAAAAPAPAPLSEAAAKKKAAAAAPADEPEVAADGGPPKLKAMEIKQMNGDALKDALKARGLQIQGAKKDLIKRLSDYEAARP